MTHDEALDILADHLHARRFRELCAEPNPDRPQRDAYRAVVVHLAGGPPPTPVVVHMADAAAPRPCGGCPGGPP